MQQTWIWSLGGEDPLKKEIATYSSTLVWDIPWTEEPGRLQSTGWQRVGHDLATEQQLFIPCPLLPGGTISKECKSALSPALWCPWGYLVVCWVIYKQHFPRDHFAQRFAERGFELKLKRFCHVHKTEAAKLHFPVSANLVLFTNTRKAGNVCVQRVIEKAVLCIIKETSVVSK